MIDKVRLDNSYHKVNPPSRKLPTDDKLLQRDPGEKGVVYEPSAGHGEKAAAKADAPAPKKEVIHTKPPEKAEGNTKEEAAPSFLTVLKNAAVKAISAIRGFFSALWNGPDAKESDTASKEAAEKTGAEAVNAVQAGKDAAAADAAAAADMGKAESAAGNTYAPPDASAMIQEILKSRDREKLMDYLTENGQKKPARNTDLLTSYDSHGRIVPVSPSDRKRILEGDFHDIKL